MQAGKLDRRISILRASMSRNSFNEQVATWEPIGTVWAAAVPVMDAERLRAGETLASSKFRFTVRSSALTVTVDPRDRIVFGNRTFDINGVKEIGRKQGLEITATARAETP